MRDLFPRRMNPGMQSFNIGRMLSNVPKFDTEQFDIAAHLDRNLTYGENVKNIRRIAGVGDTRNRGVEIHELREHERHMEHIRRQDPDRLTGRIQNEHNREIDRHLHAMRPGKRFSASGHRYYERRENHADRNPSQGL